MKQFTVNDGDIFHVNIDGKKYRFVVKEEVSEYGKDFPTHISGKEIGGEATLVEFTHMKNAIKNNQNDTSAAQ